MSLRRIQASQADSGTLIVVYRDTDWNEYRVVPFPPNATGPRRPTEHEANTYFADDRADALKQAQFWLQEENKVALIANALEDFWDKPPTCIEIDCKGHAGTVRALSMIWDAWSEELSLDPEPFAVEGADYADLLRRFDERFDSVNYVFLNRPE